MNKEQFDNVYVTTASSSHERRDVSLDTSVLYISVHGQQDLHKQNNFFFFYRTQQNIIQDKNTSQFKTITLSKHTNIRIKMVMQFDKSYSVVST